MTRVEMNCLRDTVKSRPRYVVVRTPSPCEGEGGGEGEQLQASVVLPVAERPLSLALSPQGEGTIVWGLPAYRFPHEQGYEGGIAERCSAYRQETNLIEA